MRIIELEEEADRVLAQGELDEASALSLDRSGRFTVEFPSVKNAYKFIVRSKGWVGQIPLGPELSIHIRPKVSVNAIFEMLEVAYNLKSFQFLDGETNVATVDGLFERIASILASRVIDRARKGLFQEYVSQRADLGFVRGRVDIRESLKRSASGSPYLHCEFQELTHDVEDNQLLLWTLYKVSQGSFTRPNSARLIRQAYRALNGTVAVSEKRPDDCIGRFYHRLNEDYQPLHGLCRLLLEHLGPDMKLGQAQFLPFMVNMPNLFEAFVAEWLKGNTVDTWLVTSQYTAKLTANADLRFRIDLILKDKVSGQPLAIMDTKYKAAMAPTEADIQQVVAYAVETGVTKAFLVYPSSQSNFLKARVGAIDVTSVAFDISKEIDASGKIFIEQITTLLAS